MRTMKLASVSEIDCWFNALDKVFEFFPLCFEVLCVKFEFNVIAKGDAKEFV